MSCIRGEVFAVPLGGRAEYNVVRLARTLGYLGLEIKSLIAQPRNIWVSKISVLQEKV